jgi:hypothetical protein
MLAVRFRGARSVRRQTRPVLDQRRCCERGTSTAGLAQFSVLLTPRRRGLRHELPRQRFAGERGSGASVDYYTAAVSLPPSRASGSVLVVSSDPSPQFSGAGGKHARPVSVDVTAQQHDAFQTMFSDTPADCVSSHQGNLSRCPEPLATPLLSPEPQPRIVPTCCVSH